MVGLLAVADIAAARGSTGNRLSAINVGLGDLSRGLNAFTRPAANRWPVVPALASIVLAARAHGLAAIDSSFRDDKSTAESLSKACMSSRELVRSYTIPVPSCLRP